METFFPHVCKCNSSTTEVWKAPSITVLSHILLFHIQLPINISRHYQISQFTPQIINDLLNNPWVLNSQRKSVTVTRYNTIMIHPIHQYAAVLPLLSEVYQKLCSQLLYWGWKALVYLFGHCYWTASAHLLYVRLQSKDGFEVFSMSASLQLSLSCS